MSIFKKEAIFYIPSSMHKMSFPHCTMATNGPRLASIGGTSIKGALIYKHKLVWAVTEANIVDIFCSFLGVALNGFTSELPHILAMVLDIK